MQERLSALDRKALETAATHWPALAHPGQIPPADVDWLLYLMLSGRGSGKTRAGSEWTLARARQGYRNIGLVGQTAADVRDTMIELGESSIMKVARPWERPIYEPSKRRLTFPNGAVATAFNGDEPDQLRGPQFDTVWIDELAKFKRAQECWDNIMFGLRLGKNPQAFVTTTPRAIPILRKLMADKRTITVRFSTYTNAANLSPAFIQTIESLYKGTRLGRQEIEGEILDDNPNALWHLNVIDNLRVPVAPPLLRIVIGVDPAVTSNEDSDETGIVVMGKAADGHGYVLGDYSLKSTANGWARAVVRAYRDHQADRVIGEVNNGGDLIEMNLRVVDPLISYKAVRATRGKEVRAEPISALYEQGRMHHVGTFPQLEDQMCEWQPGQKSPDRMDALVWAATELFGEPTSDPKRFRVFSAR